MRAVLLTLTVLSLTVLWIPSAWGQGLSLDLKDIVPLPNSAIDGSGQSFTVTGLSGVTYSRSLGYHTVMDNSDRVVPMTLQLAGDGSVVAADFLIGLRMDQARDHEGIAHVPGMAAVFPSDEDNPGVHQHGLDGAWHQSMTIPAVFGALRNNLGFEALTLACDRASLWTANEDALVVDGPVSTPSAGSLVRLLRFDL